MSYTGPASTGVDLLAQTTLNVDEHATQNAIGGLVAALQRVPGVLLARVTVGLPQVVVSHDAGVSKKALLLAANRAAVDVTFARVIPVVAAAASTEPTVGQMRFLRMRGAWMFVIAALAIVAIAEPNAKQWVLAAYGFALCVFLILQALSTRRPS